MRFKLFLENKSKQGIWLRIVGCVASSLVFILMLLAFNGKQKPTSQVTVDAPTAKVLEEAGNAPTADASAESAHVDTKSNNNTAPDTRVTLYFDGDDITLIYHLGKEGKGWSKGETVKQGYLSFWTGWTYPALRELGEGEHTIPYLKDTLSQEQRLTLLIDPKVKSRHR